MSRFLVAGVAVLCLALGLHAYEVDQPIELTFPESQGITFEHKLAKDLTWATLPSWDELSSDRYQLLYPGGNTICGDGSPFGFLVKKGDPERVLIEIEAGGFCYDYASCVLGPFAHNQALSDYEFMLDESTTVPPAFAALGQSVFYNEDTSTFNYTRLYISYCTGDFSMGNITKFYPQYANGSGDYRIQHHNGMINTLVALDYLKSIVPAPTQVVLTGCSSGAAASAYFISVLHDMYEDVPDVHYSVFADSFTAVAAPLFPFLFLSWGDVFQCSIKSILQAVGDITDPNFFRSTMTLEKWFVAAALTYPDTDFLVFTNVIDPLLSALYTVGLVPSPWPAAPSDAFAMETRAWVGLVQSFGLNNLHLWVEAAGPHCATPGSYSFTVPGMVQMYNTLVTGYTSSTTDHLCSTCSLAGGNGCYGSSSTYDLCFICGGDSRYCAAALPLPVFTPVCSAPTTEPTETPSPTMEPTETASPTWEPTQTASPTWEPTPTETANPTWEPTPSTTPEPTQASCQDQDDVLHAVAVQSGFSSISSCSQISKYCYNPYFFNFLSFVCPATCLSDNNDLLSSLAAAAGFGWINQCSQVSWLCSNHSVGHALRVICGKTCAHCAMPAM